MDTKISGNLIQRHTRIAVLGNADHIVSELFRIGLRHRQHPLPAHPSGQARSVVTYPCITPDFFAGCLLVPRHLLKQAWADGIQRTRDLAELFGVSKAAMRVRLRQTGTVPNGRHEWFNRSAGTVAPELESKTRSPIEVATP